MQSPSEIDRSIETLIALKAASPELYQQALGRIQKAPCSKPDDEQAHASSLAIGLLRGDFSDANAKTLLLIAAKLPRLPGGALGLAMKQGRLASLASKALRLHGPGGLWMRFIFEAMGARLIPIDEEAAIEFATRLQESSDDEDSWLGAPESFHQTLLAYFKLPIDWKSAGGQSGIDFLPWIFENWLHDSSSLAAKSALEACILLLRAGACDGLGERGCLELCRQAHEANEALQLEALGLAMRALRTAGATCPSFPLLFSRKAHPTPLLSKALELALAQSISGPDELDESGCSCGYHLNARLDEHAGSEWIDPLLAAFSLWVERGGDPRLIAAQRPVVQLAKHPLVASFIERALIDEAALPGDASDPSSI